ncbi:ricin B lectin domain-containing protein [Mycena rebaudengoi]|nr:ricin B lectin domain-containing protein [Mycena rebaudengoi]
MISPTFVALSALILSATANQIQSKSPAFFNAGIQGCVSTANNVNGAPLVIHNCNNEDLTHQDWTLQFAGRTSTNPEPIKIFGDKCIDVTGGVDADGTKLQIWTCTGGPNQQWISGTDGSFRWVGSNKCLDLTDGKITDGSQLQIWTCDGLGTTTNKNPNQIWNGAPNPDLTVRATLQGGAASSQGGPFCITGLGDTDGAKVALVGCTAENGAYAPGALNNHPYFNGSTTVWVLPVAPLIGQLKTYTNKCLDVPNGSTANGVRLQLWTCAKGNTNQLFKSLVSGQIQWAGTNKCLDLTDGKSTNGTPIQLWDCVTGNKNQIWGTNVF